VFTWPGSGFLLSKAIIGDSLWIWSFIIGDSLWIWSFDVFGALITGAILFEPTSVDYLSDALNRMAPALLPCYGERLLLVPTAV